MLEVSDDGRGGAGAGRGVGMHSMQERAREIGGQVDVSSRDRGTSVTIRLPLRAGSAGMIRVLVVDDHPLFRNGLTALLETLPDVGRRRRRR